mmetsp:Transcript_79479/g.251075  ORF Transcript_79479/g.251075 Transcript_79479/m.251075 type:complete len:283 (-) Transcript_79479:769-1617(-)
MAHAEVRHDADAVGAVVRRSGVRCPGVQQDAVAPAQGEWQRSRAPARRTERHLRGNVQAFEPSERSILQEEVFRPGAADQARRRRAEVLVRPRPHAEVALQLRRRAVIGCRFRPRPAVRQGHSNKQREGMVAALARAIDVPHEIVQGQGLRTEGGLRMQMLRKAERNLARQLLAHGSVRHARDAHHLRSAGTCPTLRMQEQVAQLPPIAQATLQLPLRLEARVGRAASRNHRSWPAQLAQDKRCCGLMQASGHSPRDHNVAIAGKGEELTSRQQCRLDLRCG